MSMGGTGIQSGRNVGTAQRLTTGQRRQVNFGGVGMEHDVQVSNRPVTGKIGGMMGMRVKTAGPQRQVQDNTYWLGVLRAKCDEIKQETDKHKQSIEQHNKDSTTYATLERKYESYIKEVRGLEGQLADYNLSMDKTRAGTNPNEILQFQMALRSKNSDHRRDVDDVFEAKNEKHQLIHKCENEIANIHEMAEQKIQKLDPHRQQHYKNMMEKNKNVSNQVNGMQNDLEQMNKQIMYLENQLQEDRHREEHHRLTKMRERLAEERQSLVEEEEASHLDPATAREKLLGKVKQTNAKISKLDEHLKALTAENKNLRSTFSDLEQEMEAKNNGENTQKKYETLFQRDQDMTQYIDKFPGTKQKELDMIKKHQVTIRELLTHMSKDLSRQGNLPSHEKVNDMKDDLTFKERQLEASKTTQERLEAELTKRQRELEKIDNLDKKIELELGSLQKKMVSMKEQMEIFKDVQGLRDAADDTRDHLVKEKNKYAKRRDSMKRQTNAVSKQLERTKSSLKDSSKFRSLKGLDDKMIHYEQNIFQLKEFIETKGRETNYNESRAECGRLMDELNTLVIANADKALSTRTQISGY
jgi:intraflagellar transport protein 74